MRDRGSAPLAIVATTPDDSHGWNLVGVQLELEARGFRVVNLGPCTPAALLAQEIRDRRPELVALSTVNGHGAMSLAAVLEGLRRYQVQRVAPIVVGGLLTTCPETLPQAEAEVLALGATAVFTGDDAWRRFDAFLAARALGAGEPGRARPRAPSTPVKQAPAGRPRPAPRPGERPAPRSRNARSRPGTCGGS